MDGTRLALTGRHALSDQRIEPGGVVVGGLRPHGGADPVVIDRLRNRIWARVYALFDDDDGAAHVRIRANSGRLRGLSVMVDVRGDGQPARAPTPPLRLRLTHSQAAQTDWTDRLSEWPAPTNRAHGRR